MIFVLGCCALVQALFLPGFLAARALGVRGGLRTATTSFALSLVANAVLVPVLVLLGLYTRPVLLPLLVAELAVALWMTAPTAWERRAAHRLTFDLSEGIAAILVAAMLLWYAGRAVRAAQGIFTGEDDIVSWNRWALDWSRGVLPRHSRHYPQLLPIAWSLTYVFTGTERVQFFARGMMPWFGIAAMLVTLDRAATPRRLASLFGAWLAGIALARVNNVTAGLADLPVAFFALACCSELLRSAPDEPAETRQRLILGASFAAGAAMTKQAGLLVALLYPLLAWKLVAGSARHGRTLAAATALLAVLVLPWYAWTEHLIQTGREASEVPYVTGEIFAGRPPLERLTSGIASLAGPAGGVWVLAALALLIALGWTDRRMRWVIGLVGLPGLLLWGLWFSYDPRNLSVSLGALMLGSGSGLAWLFGRVGWPSTGISLPRAPAIDPRWAVALAGAGIVIGGLVFPDAALLARQDRLQRSLGDPEVTRELYRLRDGPGFQGRILTGEGLPLACTPGWDSIFVISTFADSVRFARAAAGGEIAFVLAPSPGPGPVGPMLDRWMREGRYREAARAGRWVLLARTARRDTDSAAGGDSRR